MNEKKCRQLVAIRSQGLCERCGRRGDTFHHRKNRSAGGGWSLTNIVHLCGDGTRGCHGWVTTHPKLAGEEGFHIPSWVAPEQVPILLHKRIRRRLSATNPRYDTTHDDVDIRPPIMFEEEGSDGRFAEDHDGWQSDW